MNAPKKKAPAAQVEMAKKAAAMRAKTANATRAKQASLPIALNIDANGDGIRLLSKVEVLDRVGVSYPTLWHWMRAGTFPRSRALGASTVWIAAEVEAWMASLPKRPLKGDVEAVA
jgi:predicted DNA-binding transcriptional regulator AlpA